MTTAELKNADLKTLDLLDEKIKRAVEVVTRLKGENASMSERMAALKASADAGADSARELESVRKSHEHLSTQVDELRSERQRMLERVDGLLDKLKALSLD